jgi:hypothetical protein
MVISIINLNGKPVPDQPSPTHPPKASIPFKGFKTISVAATFLLTVLSSPDVQNIIAQYPKGFASAIAVITVLLRLLTTTPAFSNQSTITPKENP